MDEKALRWLGAMLPLVALFEAEVRRQVEASGQTREQVLDAASQTWAQAKDEVADLAALRRE